MSTASEHVARLEGGRLVTTVRIGRHRMARLRDARIARTLEELAVLAAANSAQVAIIPPPAMSR